MDSVDVLLRVAGGTLLATLTLFVVSDRPRDRASWLFALFALGVCGFLAGNTPDERLLPSGAFAAVADLFGRTAAVALWWFGLSMFDDDFRLRPIHIGVGAVWFLVLVLDEARLTAGPVAQGGSWLLIVLGVGMVGDLGWRLLRDRGGDLVEGRRTARLTLAGVSAALLLVDLGVDVVLGFGWKPQGFTVAQNAAVFAVTVWVASWLLRADAALLTFRAPKADTPALSSVVAQHSVPRPRDSRLLRRLIALMETEHPHRDPNLTFAGFAAKMGASEKEVRRLINQELGHRHFRSFLNSYRLAEVRDALADPAKADQKIVTIAFDAGFASLASFNRAFRLAEDCSPTEFREAGLPSGCLEQGQSGLGPRPTIAPPSKPDRSAFRPLSGERRAGSEQPGTAGARRSCPCTDTRAPHEPSPSSPSWRA